VGGTILEKDFLDTMRQAGLADVELVAETGFNTSPVTRGVLIQATKPVT
jgi:hypothetical protein